MPPDYVMPNEIRPAFPRGFGRPVAASLGTARSGRGADDPCSYVDPFIGTTAEANVVPGPCLPFGMVKLSPDCDLDFSNSVMSQGVPSWVSAIRM